MHRFGSACIFFLVLFVEDFCFDALFVSSKNWLSLNHGDLDYGGRGANSAVTDRKLCLFPTETDICHLLYATLLLLKPFFWMKEICTNLERTLAGTDKKLPFPERHTFFIWSTPTPSCWNHSSWMKEILHKLHLQKNFTTFSSFTFDGVAFCFKSFIPLLETGMNKSRGRHVIPKHEQIERPNGCLWLWAFCVWGHL